MKLDDILKRNLSMPTALASSCGWKFLFSFVWILSIRRFHENGFFCISYCWTYNYGVCFCWVDCGCWRMYKVPECSLIKMYFSPRGSTSATFDNDNRQTVTDIQLYLGRGINQTVQGWVPTTCITNLKMDTILSTGSFTKDMTYSIFHDCLWLLDANHSPTFTN